MSFLDRLFGRKKAPSAPPGEIYAKLRGQALALTPAQLGGAAEGDAVFGVLMDMGLGGAQATVVALADGSTSLYTSTGGGVIGGGQHAEVAAATRALLAAAERDRALLAPGDPVGAIADGEIRLIALVPSGRLVAADRADVLGSGRRPLSPLFTAANEVITQLRQVSSRG